MRPFARGALGALALVAMDAAIVVSMALSAGSCQAVKDYSEAAENAAPPVIGAGVGAIFGGPFGAAIGAGIGAVISFFKQAVAHLRVENVQLRTGKLFGAETAHAPWQGPPLIPALPWYMNPWGVGRLAIGWAVLLLFVWILARKFGHPVFRWLQGLLTLGVVPAVAMIRKKAKA